MTAGPVAHSRLHGANDLACQRRILDERRATAPRRHVVGWTAHIDVHAVEAESTDHLCCLVKPVRVGTIDLCQDRTLALDKPQLSPCRLEATADLLDMDEFGVLHIGLAVSGDNAAK